MTPVTFVDPLFTGAHWGPGIPSGFWGPCKNVVFENSRVRPVPKWVSVGSEFSDYADLPLDTTNVFGIWLNQNSLWVAYDRPGGLEIASYATWIDFQGGTATSTFTLTAPGVPTALRSWGFGSFALIFGSQIGVHAIRANVTDALISVPIVGPPGQSGFEEDRPTVVATFQLNCFAGSGNGVAWSDQKDLYNWTPSSFNTAGSLTLSEATSDISAMEVLRGRLMVYTASDVFEIYPLGPPLYFGYRRVLHGNAGAANALAVVSVHNKHYVYSLLGGFYVTDGQQAVPLMAREDQQYIDSRFDASSARSVRAYYDNVLRVVKWTLTRDNTSECYGVNIDNGTWSEYEPFGVGATGATGGTFSGDLGTWSPVEIHNNREIMRYSRTEAGPIEMITRPLDLNSPHTDTHLLRVQTMRGPGSTPPRLTVIKQSRFNDGGVVAKSGLLDDDETGLDVRTRARYFKLFFEGNTDQDLYRIDLQVSAGGSRTEQPEMGT